MVIRDARFGKILNRLLYEKNLTFQLSQKKLELGQEEEYMNHFADFLAKERLPKRYSIQEFESIS